jgi:hypothetical protein
MMPNGLSRRLRVRVIPCRVRILLAINQYRVIPRHPLPGAVRTRGTGLQKCPVYSLFWEINVSFNCLNLIALRDGLSVPNSLCHYPPSNRFNKMQRLDALEPYEDEEASRRSWSRVPLPLYHEPTVNGKSRPRFLRIHISLRRATNSLRHSLHHRPRFLRIRQLSPLRLNLLLRRPHLLFVAALRRSDHFLFLRALPWSTLR